VIIGCFASGTANAVQDDISPSKHQALLDRIRRRKTPFAARRSYLRQADCGAATSKI